MRPRKNPDTLHDVLDHLIGTWGNADNDPKGERFARALDRARSLLKQRRKTTRAPKAAARFRYYVSAQDKATDVIVREAAGPFRSLGKAKDAAHVIGAFPPTARRYALSVIRYDQSNGATLRVWTR